MRTLIAAVKKVCLDYDDKSMESTIRRDAYIANKLRPAFEAARALEVLL